MTHFIDLPTARIAYRSVGNGPDLVFVHGWPVDSETYRYLIPALSKQFTCHLFDLPGAGKTIWNEQTDISLSGHCETLQQVVDHLNLSAYALFAQDSGGVFARHLAAIRPDHVRGMVLCNTDIPKIYASSLKMLITSAKIPGYSKLMPALLRYKAFRLSGLFGQTMFYDLDKFEADFGDRYIQPLYENPAVFAGQMALIRNWEWSFLDGLTQIHRQISAPVQLIWGREDVIFPLKHAQKMVDELGGQTELHVINNSRLYVHEEQPAQVLQVAQPFLQSCFRDGAVAHDTPSN